MREGLSFIFSLQSSWIPFRSLYTCVIYNDEAPVFGLTTFLHGRFNFRQSSLSRVRRLERDEDLFQSEFVNLCKTVTGWSNISLRGVAKSHICNGPGNEHLMYSRQQQLSNTHEQVESSDGLCFLTPLLLVPDRWSCIYLTLNFFSPLNSLFII